MDVLKKLYELLIKSGVYLQHLGLLLLRLYYGFKFFEAGRGKLGDIARVTSGFESMGIPLASANAHLVTYLEYGGIALMAGAASRLFALPLSITMIVALATAHRGEVAAVVSNPIGALEATPVPFLAAALVILACGPGVFSVDGIVKHTVFRNGDKG